MVSTREPVSRLGLDGRAGELFRQVLGGTASGDAALQASQHMLQLVLDTIPQAIWWKDRDCIYLGANRYLANLIGVESQDMIGKNDFDMPWAKGERYGASWYREWDREVMEAGVARYGIKEELTVSDGSTIWIETNKVPLRDLDGNVIAVLGSFRDVTESHLADQARRHAMAELDKRVRERTSALRQANEKLRREVKERTRLEAQERKQRAYAEALRDTAAAVAESLDLDETLEQVLVGVERFIAHHRSAVVLVNNEGTHTLAHTRGRRVGQLVDGFEIGADVGSVPFITTLRSSSGPTIDNDVAGGAVGVSTRSAVGAPITVSDNRIGYVIAESDSPGCYDSNHAERLNAIADLAGSAISNAQLFYAEAELAALEERQRLARELHDAVSQTLWTASLVSDSILTNSPKNATYHQIDRLRVLTRGALAEMRSLLLELRPASLVETPFVELLEQLADALQGRRSIRAVVNSHVGYEFREPAPPAKHALYRIAQEALNNVAKHSGATDVQIKITTDKGELVLTISDNGRGFCVSDAKCDRLGLSIMRERADGMGASFCLTSVRGEGTTVSVSVPLATMASQR